MREMEPATGVAVSLISMETYEDVLGHIPLQPTDIGRRTPEGVIYVIVKLNNQSAELPLYVVSGDAQPLFGREWFRSIKLNWQEIKTVQKVWVDTLKTVLQRHSGIFAKVLGTMKGIEAKVTQKPNCTPKFCQSRAVPYAI